VRHAAPAQASNEPGRVSAGRHGARRRAKPPGVRPVRARSGQLPYLLVLFGVAIALVVIRQGVHLVRSGTLVFAGVLLIAATARLVLPERRAGMLSSRRRLLDVAILGVLGIGLLVAGLVVPVPG
jgi:hypothetical protein